MAKQIDMRSFSDQQSIPSSGSLQVITDAVPVLISYVDRQLRYRFVNKAYENWFGYSNEQIIGRTIKDVIGGTAFANIEKHLETVLTGQRTKLQNVVPHKDGSLRNIEVTFIPDITEPGETQGIFVLANDISEIIEKQEKLETSEQQFRILSSLSPSGIYLTANNGDCIYVNQAWCEMAGMNQEEALGQGWTKGLHHEDRDKVFGNWNKLVAAEGKWGLEYRFLTPEGKTTWVLGQAKAMHDLNGTPIGFMGVNTDVTQIKEARELLQHSNDQLERKVQERTAELLQQKAEVEEVNTALKVILREGTKEREELEQVISSNIKQLILPHLEKLGQSGLKPAQEDLHALLKNSLEKVLSPFTQNLQKHDLTPTEKSVAEQVQQGLSTKRIAELMHISSETVSIHRKNIRKKLGLNGKTTNLQSYLSNLENS